MDSALREILREERRRKNKDPKKSRDDRHDDRKDRHDKDSKHETRQRNERNERKDRNEKKEKKDVRKSERKSERKVENSPKRVIKKQIKSSIRRKSEPIIRSVEFLDDKHEIIEDDGIGRFLFVFEDKDGQLFTKLDLVQKNENDEVKIFPVYITGYNSNLNEEIITFKNGIWNPSEENIETTWLKIITSSEDNIEILTFENKDVVVYNSKFFHCEKDLYEYLESNGPEVLSILK